MDLSVQIQYPVLPARLKTEFHILFRLAAAAAPVDRPRINLVLVLDRSGSMRDRKITATKEAAKLLVERLSSQDSLAIVVYGTDVKTLLKPTPLTDREGVKRVIDSITTGGTTNLSGGWLMGLRLAAKAHRRQTVTRVLLMTDGLANRGITASRKLRDIAAQHSRKGLVTSTLGIGEGFNEETLSEIAAGGTGNFHYIRHADDASPAFAAELGDVLSVAAQNVTFQFVCESGFSVSDILNAYPHNREGSTFEAFAGDIYGGEDKKLLLRVQAEPTPPGRRALLQARIEYDLVAEGTSGNRIDETVECDFKEDAASVAPDESVVLELGLLRSARVRQKAMALADGGNYAQARAILLAAVRELSAQRICAERLGPELAEMRHYAEAFSQREWTVEGRKTLSASIFLSRGGRLVNRRDRIIDTRVDDDS